MHKYGGHTEREKCMNQTMILTKTTENHIRELVAISKSAFDSDIMVGGAGVGGPPGYDSVEWHTEMMNQGHLFTAIVEDNIVGGAILFGDDNTPSFMYVGRIFISPEFFRRGYGIELMKQIELLNSNVTMWCLDTPVWNQRTNNFYTKIGYEEKRRDAEMVYYQKGYL